jgi:predicted DNA-binding transcriptional regulator AlpA
MTTREVCALARYSRTTLFSRIDAGAMPKPVDRGGAGFLFDRTAVSIALGMYKEVVAPQKSWDFDPVAYKAALAREKPRRGAKP